MKFSPSKNRSHFESIMNVSSDSITLKSDETILENLKTMPEEMDFNHVDGDFNTVLYLACANHCVKTVDYLLNERKVDPNIKVSEQLTAAHIAAMKGDVSVLRLLSTVSQVQLSEKDAYGETPLFRAIDNAPANKLQETVKIILEKDNASVTMTNEDGTFPIEIALRRNNPDVIKLLLNHGAEVTKRCCQDAADLMIANSQTSSQFGGVMVFFTNSAQNKSLRDCAELIINAYNATHLAEDLKTSLHS